MHVQIVKVIFKENFLLNIFLTNGGNIIYDLKPKLVTARFRDIENWEQFCTGKVIEGKIIRWNLTTELSLDEILLNLNEM